MPNPRNRRTKTQLSDTRKALESRQAEAHLADPIQHAIDVEKTRVATQEWMEEELKLEKGVTPGEAEELVQKSLKFPSVQHRSVYNDAILQGSGVTMIIDRNGSAMETEEWIRMVRLEREARRTYVTKDRHHLEVSPIEVLWLRLPPWIALVAGKVISERSLSDIAIELMGVGAKEFGWEFIGCVGHVETDRDVHLHPVFTAIKARKVSRDPNKAEIKRRRFELNKLGRTHLKGKDLPTDAKNLKAFVDAQITSGVWELPDRQVSFWECYRDKLKRKELILGPSFLNKYQIWMASGKGPAIAVKNDRDESQITSFRARMTKLEEMELEALFLDLWFSNRYQELVLSRLSQNQLQEVEEAKKKAVDDYVKYDTTYLSPELRAAKRDVEQAEVKLQELERILANARKEIEDGRKTQDIFYNEATALREKLEKLRKEKEAVEKKAEAQASSLRRLQGVQAELSRQDLVAKERWDHLKKVPELVNTIWAATTKSEREAARRRVIDYLGGVSPDLVKLLNWEDGPKME